MALEITWGTNEAHQLADVQTRRLLRAGIYATYAAHFRAEGHVATMGSGRPVRYRNALYAELPLLAFIADETNSAGLIGESPELHVAKVDPETGVRLDLTSLSIADVTRQETLPRWMLTGSPRHELVQWQALLALGEALELASHGLAVR